MPAIAIKVRLIPAVDVLQLLRELVLMKALTPRKFNEHCKTLIDSGVLSLTEAGNCEVRDPRGKSHPTLRGKKLYFRTPRFATMYAIELFGTGNNTQWRLQLHGPLVRGEEATKRYGTHFAGNSHHE